MGFVYLITHSVLGIIVLSSVFSVVSEIPAIQFHFISAARHIIPLITACNSISRIIIPDSILIVVKTENLSFSGCSNATVLTIVTGGGV